jgi:DDE superfamily endonuclease
VLQPQRSRYWLNAKEKDTPEFQRQVQDVCDTYRKAPERLKNEGIHTICVDEKTGMQALERVAETLPMKPGLPESREHEYIRHGTQCLTANFEVATGKVIAPTIETTRSEAEFAAHIKQTIATDPKAGWIFVVDNLTTHCSETLVLLLAALLGIPEPTLGKKGKSGVLETVPTRRTFLADPSHRIRFVYVPKHTSWLNQVEIWFSVLSRRLLRRGNFRSTADLRKQVLAFIDYQNRMHAKPYRWTYTGRPLAA